jgi:hypothetical protein
MSANADILHEPVAALRDAVGILPAAEVAGERQTWNPEHFAREQILGLVRRIFLSSGLPPVKQVVFSAAESNIDVAGICEQVAFALSRETPSQIALLDWDAEVGEKTSLRVHSKNSPSIKSGSTQLSSNLWRIQKNWGSQNCDSRPGRYRTSFLMELREEFEYTVITGPSAGISSEAALLGHITDGLILVVAAHSTRKATARKLKDTLQASQSRILGTILAERTFPIPQGIYRRL